MRSIKNGIIKPRARFYIYAEIYKDLASLSRVREKHRDKHISSRYYNRELLRSRSLIQIRRIIGANGAQIRENERNLSPAAPRN